MRYDLKQTILHTKEYTLAFVRWLALSLIVGISGGLFGTLFAKTLSFVTQFRLSHSWLIFLLPLGGLISVAVYKYCRVTGIGTDDVFESVRSEKSVPPLLAPAVFIGSAITHLLGGSAGREGAALQLGGSISSALSKLLHLDEKARHILTMCGMGAFFSALFGTPLGAAVFAIEVVSVGSFCSAALFPGIVSSVTAYSIAISLGVHPERFFISSAPELSLDIIWRVGLIAVVGAIVSIAFCHLMHYTEGLFKKLFKNGFIRIFIGGLAVVVITLLLNTTDYNGGGIEVINRIFTDGDVKYEAFLIKMILTAITIGAGYKGGEIVPTLFIGATLGGAMAILIGLNPAFGAAIGMAALFSGVTNCPLATIFLCIEMFSGKGLIFIAIAVAISFLLSDYCSLYSKQTFMFSKLNEATYK